MSYERCFWWVRGVTTLTGGFGGLLSFAKSCSDDKVAPIPDLHALAPEWGGSTHNGRSAFAAGTALDAPQPARSRQASLVLLFLPPRDLRLWCAHLANELVTGRRNERK
jgi:hypothetical protein